QTRLVLRGDVPADRRRADVDLHGARGQRAALAGPGHLRRPAAGESPDRADHERDPGGAVRGDPEAPDPGARDDGPAGARRGGRLQEDPRENLDDLPVPEVTRAPAVDDYKDLLAGVDAWYKSVKDAHPAEVPCSKGCRECCVGLFDVSLADRDLLREGLAKADPAVRKDIEARAEAVVARLREVEPDLGETLDGMSPEAIDD